MSNKCKSKYFYIHSSKYLNNIFGSIIFLNSCGLDEKMPSLLPLMENREVIADLFFINSSNLEHGCLYSEDTTKSCKYRGSIKCRICKEQILSRGEMKLIQNLTRLGGLAAIKNLLLDHGFKQYYPKTISK